jgi:hypothetical protein
LANHGYVTPLLTAHGDRRVLLVPELLNNLAASIVNEARRNDRGLGSVEESSILGEGLRLPEVRGLTIPEREVLLDAAIAASSAAQHLLPSDRCVDVAGRPLILISQCSDSKSATDYT